MKKLLLSMVFSSLTAAVAFAAGANITAVACQGSAGSATDVGYLDCASGGALNLQLTFEPAQGIADLIAADIRLELGVQISLSEATFWDFASANSGALSCTSARPTGICNGYLNTFGTSGSGATLQSEALSQHYVQVLANTHRPTPTPVLANQRLFALALLVDMGTAVEAGSGGQAIGCGAPAWLSIRQLTPISQSGASTGSFEYGPTERRVTFFPVGLPAASTSWGALKALYR